MFNKKNSAKFVALIFACIAALPFLTKIFLSIWDSNGHFVTDLWRTSSWIASYTSKDMLEANSEEIAKSLVWRSVYGAGIDGTSADQSLLSLNPIDRSLMPVIFNIDTNQFIELKLPSFPSHPEIQSLQVIELLEFSSGLAAAKVHLVRKPPSGDLIAEHLVREGDDQTIDANPLKQLGHDEDLWGFVDPSGNWVIPPIYKSVSKFVGGIAVVEQRHPKEYENSYLKLIHRSGKLLTWSAYGSPGWKTSADLIKLSMVGNYVIVIQSSAWSDDGDPRWLVRGQQWIQFPSGLDMSNTNYRAFSDPSGSLFMIEREGKHFLWRPESGEIKLPSTTLLIEPLTDRAIAVDSDRPATVAVQNLDGRIVADGLMFTYPLTDKYFVACPQNEDTNYGVDMDMLLNMDSYGRGMRPQYHPYARCGLMDSEGQWRAQPIYEMIDRISTDTIRLQSGTTGCVISLEGELPCTQDKSDSQALNKPVPVLDMRDTTKTPRLYGYQLSRNVFSIPPRFELASAFFGKTANVLERNQPGLINTKGQWLTPRLTGTEEQQAIQYLAIAHHLKDLSRYNIPKITKAWGVRDINLGWVVPPLYRQLMWYEDGTLLACNSECRHLNIHGKILKEASNLKGLNEKEAQQEKLVELPIPNTGQELVAVSINNGKWGYQRGDGSWAIQPKFDDANDFSNGKAEAAMLMHKEANDNEPAKDYLAWGIINESGEWITPPGDESMPLTNEALNNAKPRYPFLNQYALAESPQIPVAHYTYPLGVVVDVATLNAKGYMSVTFAKGDELKVGLVDANARWLMLSPHKNIADYHRSRH